MIRKLRICNSKFKNRCVQPCSMWEVWTPRQCAPNLLAEGFFVSSFAPARSK